MTTNSGMCLVGVLILVVGCTTSPHVWKAHVGVAGGTLELLNQEWVECHKDAVGLIVDFGMGREDYPLSPSIIGLAGFKWAYVTSFGRIGPRVWAHIEARNPKLPQGIYPPVSQTVVDDPMKRMLLTDEIVMICLYNRGYRIDFSDGTTFDKNTRR